MPQIDRYKPRTVAIEFTSYETFTTKPLADRNRLVLISNGRVTLTINAQSVTLVAPTMLCLNADDHITVEASQHLAAQTFAFHPDFFKTAPLVSAGEDYDLTLTLQTGNQLCAAADINARVFSLNKASYRLIVQWFFQLGMEVTAQSDALWVCRIKQQLIHIFNILTDLFRDKSQQPLDLALDYIYLHYTEAVTLEDIVLAAHTNRNSLNQAFKKRFGVTAMTYLNDYRLKIAKEMLVHTGMSVGEIARVVGFNYDTYFMRKFQQAQGQSPTDYRRATRLVVHEM